MKKIILIACSLLCVIIIMVAFAKNKKTYLSDYIVESDIVDIKISLFSDNENEVTIDNQFEIDRLLKEYNKISLYKRSGEPKTGFSYEVTLNHRNNKKDTIIVSKEIVINGAIYNCDDKFYNITEETFNNMRTIRSDLS